MRLYELKLDPSLIYALLSQKAFKEKQAYYCAKKNKLRLKLAADKKAFAVAMELRPSFYKLRPIDLQLQIRHNRFKLTPISNTTQSPDRLLNIKKSCLYSAMILRGLQNTADQYKATINKKFLTINLIKKLDQDNLVANQRLQLRLSPYKYLNT